MVLTYQKSQILRDGELFRTPQEVAKEPSRIDGVIQQLWDMLSHDEQQVLAALSLVGEHVPVAIQDELFPPNGEPVDACYTTGWIRERAYVTEFIESARWQVARKQAVGHDTTARQRFVQQAMEASLRLIVTATPGSDGLPLSILRTCIANLAEEALALSLRLDTGAVGDVLDSWSEDLRLSLDHRDSLRVLLLLERVVSARRVPDDATVTLAFAAARRRAQLMLNLHGPMSVEAVEATKDYLELARSFNGSRRVDEVRALLQLSRAYRDGTREGTSRARTPVTEATQLCLEHALEGLAVQRDLLSASYPLTYRDGDTSAAADQAAQTADLATTLYGPFHSLTLGALNDRAFYLLRLSPEAGLAAYRHVLHLKRQQWHDDRHPSVAKSKGNVAVALTLSDKVDDRREAVALADEAHHVLVNTLGQRHTATLNAAGASAEARLALADVQDSDEAEELRRGAAAMARDTIRRRLDIRPHQRPWLSEARLGYALACLGDRAGLDLQQDVFNQWSRRFPNPESNGEVRWMATRLARSLARFGHYDAARNMRTTYGIEADPHV